jgi:hypothetical protein
MQKALRDSRFTGSELVRYKDDPGLMRQHQGLRDLTAPSDLTRQEG